MKEFLKSLVSSKGDMSSKRVAALFTLLNVLVLVYIATFHQPDKVTPAFMFDALCWIIAGGLGLASIDNIFAKKNPEDKKLEYKEDKVENQ